MASILSPEQLSGLAVAFNEHGLTKDEYTPPTIDVECSFTTPVEPAVYLVSLFTPLPPKALPLPEGVTAQAAVIVTDIDARETLGVVGASTVPTKPHTTVDGYVLAACSKVISVKSATGTAGMTPEDIERMELMQVKPLAVGYR